MAARSGHRDGALMLATAIHLPPSRLMIAGIDLYLHPQGKYPDATGESNEYDAIHHRDIDLAFVRAALDGFNGEVDVRSQQLRSAWRTDDVNPGGRFVATDWLRAKPSPGSPAAEA